MAATTQPIDANELPCPLSTTIENGKEILRRLQEIFASFKTTSAIKPWLRQFDEIKGHTDSVIIGVVGATGSGKSSLINSLLDELQLIPTNCMRACTATVTEISWNEQSGAPWRAHVEFLKPDEWRKELENLFGDVAGAVGSVNDEESEAGVAFSKIVAVYPHVNKRNVLTMSIEELMQQHEVVEYLGTEILVNAVSGKELHDRLKSYIDSKEKFGVPSDNEGYLSGTGEALNSIEYWPLISRVRIFGRAPVLKSGCTIVDLPGIADSNAARGAIAKEYLKNCSALFVAAPIIRAVDDKTARHLLGTGFKRQLQRDGTLAKVSFICTKTDDIRIHEARSILNRDPTFVEDVDMVDRAKAQIANDRNAIEETVRDNIMAWRDASQKHVVLYQEERDYRHLKNLAALGTAVFPPLPVELKSRKRAAPDHRALLTPKKPRLDEYMYRASQSPARNEEFASQIVTKKEPRQVRQDTSKPALTLECIDRKIAELETARNNVKEQTEQLRATKHCLDSQLEELKALEDDALAKEWVACVVGRNKYAKLAIQLDFAAGLRDLIQEDQQEDDLFNPDEDIDAEVEPTATLPVFCVSSQGYQESTGQLAGEQIVARFSDISQTGVPALRAHAFILGQEQLTDNEEAFLNNGSRLLTSLRLWSAGGVEHILMDPEDEANQGAAEKLVDDIVQAVAMEASSTLKNINGMVEDRIYEVLPEAIGAANIDALDIVAGWSNSPKDLAKPGLRFNTYKAICRRNGNFSNISKEYNFDSDLLRPLLDRIDGNWSFVFGGFIKQRFAATMPNCGKLIDKFSKQFESIMTKCGSSPNARHMFNRQVICFAKLCSEALKTARKRICCGQKDINRHFEEAIGSDMRTAYLPCAQQHGSGCYRVMQNIMKNHVEVRKDTMFTEAAQTVKYKLEVLMEETIATLAEDMEKICSNFKRDCSFLVFNRAREFKALRKNVQEQILYGLVEAEAAFIALVLAHQNMAIDPAILTNNDFEVDATIVNDGDDDDDMGPAEGEILDEDYDTEGLDLMDF